MDTRFWGPSGWRLLHLITFAYQPSVQKESVRELFSMLPFVLPCKFCRASLTDYLEQEPINSSLSSKEALSKWLYRVHNLVNEKLKGQGLLHETNPTFASVKKVYEERISAGCVRTDFEGWDFLFSIAENHPFSASSKKSSPMPGLPPDLEKSEDPIIRNRWNILSPEHRIPFYIRFWEVLGEALPFSEWRSAWNKCSPKIDLAKNKAKWIRELWRVRCCMENQLDLVNREKFESVCKRLEEHKSGCNKKKRARTCRKKKN
jgi:hypothetical protein